MDTWLLTDSFYDVNDVTLLGEIPLWPLRGRFPILGQQLCVLMTYVVILTSCRSVYVCLNDEDPIQNLFGQMKVKKKNDNENDDPLWLIDQTHHL